MKRADIEKIIAELHEQASDLLEDNARCRKTIAENEADLVGIETALNEYYEQLEMEAE